MAKWMLVLFALIPLVQCAKVQRAESNEPTDASSRLATVSVDYLRIREGPGTEAAILGRLMKNTEVLILQRSKEKQTVASAEAYWYELTTIEGIRGWAFGQFLKITDRRSNSKAFLAKYERASDLPDQPIDLSIANGFERRRMHSEADSQYKKLPNAPFVKYLIEERKLLRKASFAWLRDSPRDIHAGISEQLSKRSSILPLLPPSIDLGTYASEFWGVFSNAGLNAFLLKNLREDYSLSELVMLSEDKAVFYIDQAKWQDYGNRLLFCIFRIKGSAFKELDNKYELATVMFSRSAAFSDPRAEGFAINYPYFKLWVYGLTPGR